MKHTTPSKKTIVALALGIALSGAVQAEDDTMLDETIVEVITVTASGHETVATKTPHSVTVVDKGKINEGNYLNVGDLLKGSAGVSLTTDGAWGINPVVRGLKKEQIVLLVDGIRINSAQPYGAIASLVNLDQLERVEVVKGPVAVLYGSGAIGGVINFVTKKADFTDQPMLMGSATLGYSSVDEGKRAATSLLMSNDQHALTLNLSKLDIGDYDSPDGEVANTGFEQLSGSIHYKAKIGESNELELKYQNQQDDDVWFIGSAKPHPFHQVQTIHSPKTERTLTQAIWTSELFNGDGELSASVYKQDVDRTIYAYSNKLERDVVRNTVSFETTGSNLHFDYSGFDNHLVRIGADTWKMEASPARYMDTNAPDFDNNVRNDPFSNGEVTSTGIFVQDSFSVDSWSLKTGARVDKVEGDADTAAGKPPGTDLSNKDTMFSWSLGAAYNASDLVNPYVNISRAHRAPDMRERFESSPRGDGYMHLGNPMLEPEQSTTFELGLKGSDQSMQYSVSAYFSKIDDYIAGRITGQNHPGNGLPLKQTENLAEVEMYGFEGDFQYRLTTDLALFGTFSYLRGENKYDDEPLAFVPAPELSLGVEGNIGEAWNWHATARAVAEQDRVGSKLTNNTEDATSGYTTFDLGVSYHFATNSRFQHKLSLLATNLMDKSYHEHLAEGITDWEADAQGRNIQLTWHTEF